MCEADLTIVESARAFMQLQAFDRLALHQPPRGPSSVRYSEPAGDHVSTCMSAVRCALWTSVTGAALALSAHLAP